MAQLNVLELVTQFCQQTGLPVPAAVIGTNEGHSVQMRALLNKVVMDLGQYTWQQSDRRVTWVSIAGEDQGALVDILGADGDYRSMIPNTLWDVTEQRPIYGPVSDSVWQYYKAVVNPGPIYQYTIKRDHLLLSPNMPAGHTLSAAMYSNFVVIGVGGVYKEFITADDDTFIFPNIVALRGLTWNWKEAKGEDWEASQQLYLDAVANNLVKDTATRVRLDDDINRAIPGIVVPAGSWPV
jgi:hypothetical protein